MTGAISLLRGKLTILLIAAAFLWSAWTVMRRSVSSPANDPDVIVLRLAHWQLETGFRDAVNAMGKAYSEQYYQRTGKRVLIVQDAIPETVYGTFCSTNLVGGTAPDIVAVGLGLPSGIWREYLNRYFLPISGDINRPNPHNVGTDLEGVPFKQTYLDGGRSAYNEDLQNYMTVPLSVFATRLFYNEELFQELTGLEKPPTEWRAFLRACDEILKHEYSPGKRYTPIVSSSYHFNFAWTGGVADPLTWSLMYDADFNRDSSVSPEEFYIGMRTGQVSFQHPVIRARFKVIDQLKPYFPEGWTGKQRDEGVFLFSQKRAVFIPTGTWDAKSLQEQARGEFTVKVVDYPYPTPDDADFGRFVRGRRYDRPLPNQGMGITRQCKHPEIAFDFLQFLASQKGNEQFNGMVGWIPAIKGAAIPENLRGFEPSLRGMYGNFAPALSGRSQVRLEQLQPQFQNSEITYDEFATQFTADYFRDAREDFKNMQRDWKRGALISEQFLVTLRRLVEQSPADRRYELYWRYVRLSAVRHVFPTVDRARMLELIAKTPVDGPGGGADASTTTSSSPLGAPYSLGEAARERVLLDLRRRTQSAAATIQPGASE